MSETNGPNIMTLITKTHQTIGIVCSKETLHTSLIISVVDCVVENTCWHDMRTVEWIGKIGVILI